MDSWFEEDEEIFVHARDPHKRIDSLRSSRHVVVEIDGVPVADSSRPVLLFETDLPDALLPAEDRRPHGPAHPDDSLTRCPYKGVAEYYSVNLETRPTTTSSGGTAIRRTNRRRSPLSWRSTTRKSTTSSTACARSGRSRRSPERPCSGPVLLCSSASFSPLQAPFQGRDVPVSKKCRLRTLVFTLGVVRQAL